MFYTRIPYSRRVIKVLPPIIEKLLTPCALAYWIMDDGQYVKNGGLTLCTDNFTSRVYDRPRVGYKLAQCPPPGRGRLEVAALKTILENKYGLLCTLHNKKGKDRIYISFYQPEVGNRSLPFLKALVLPYMHPNFKYKLDK